MKSSVLTLVLLALPALAQRQNFTINVGTPEGQQLQAIGQESDEAKKVALMEDFLGKYAKHEGAPWVCGQLELVYLQQKQFDKALDAADKVYSGNPNDLDLSYNAIKAAEGKDDPEQVKKWAEHTADVAHKMTASGKAPADADEKADIDHAKEVGTYADYSLYAAALKSRDSKVVVELAETLEKVDPKSQYLWLVSQKYLGALGAKGCASAARLAAADSKNAEALLFEADCSWRGARADGVISSANRALEALNSRPKVEGGGEGAKIGTANFFIGIGNAMQQRWGPANKALRAALPAVKGESIYEANALFSLGLANYTLGKALGDKSQMREGLHFFEQSAAIKSNVQDQASKNATLIRGELGGK
jgi:tetratricopeptide (TPR) repeat protein